MTAREIRSVNLLRSCCRCGREFRRERGALICPTCRYPERRSRPLNPKLGFRERQVISLVSQAKLNKEIAYDLHLTEGTIKQYIYRIFRKLGINNRTELAVWAVTLQPQQVDECVPLMKLA